MVAVAQLVESRIVIPVVVGSSPISHPILPVIRGSAHSCVDVRGLYVGIAYHLAGRN